MRNQNRYNFRFIITFFTLIFFPISHDIATLNAAEGDSSVEVSNSSTPITATPKIIEQNRSGISPVNVGPLELTPSNVFIRLETCNGSNKCIITTVKFTIKNKSSSDVKFILFKKSFAVTDNYGNPLFGRISGGGLRLSEADTDHLERAIIDERAKLTTLTPNQSFEAQIITDGIAGYELDGNRLSLYMKLRPRSMTLSAIAGIESLDSPPQLYSFSFSDVPIQIIE